MAVVNITRGQYRTFAEIAKASGCVLTLSTVEEMKCFGGYSPMATGVVEDATDCNSWLIEKAAITLARSINPAAFRSTGRPELDWGKLEDHEILPFVFWHEIGHRVDNFDAFSVAMLEDLDARSVCQRYVTGVNEVLADRYAWNKIRPGEPLPLSNNGKRLKREIAVGGDLLREHAKHTSAFTRQPLQAGQYRSVPVEMLREPWKAQYVGTKVADAWRESRR